MKVLNIYEVFLSFCLPHTEEDIDYIEQFDYHNGKYNDFNAPSSVFTLKQYEEVANRYFTLAEFHNYRYEKKLDPLVKIYVRFKDGSSGAFEIMYGDEGMGGCWSSIPKPQPQS